ncbi:MAG: hypothetical protein OFPI_32150 [Osedax symbiont Rs2]|nr:MAG: hypothetical protein OFPI_32150 [Osedax symbiont Rs2]
MNTKKLFDSQLWQQLYRAKLVSQSKSPEIQQSLWYLRLLQGFAGWLAACFLLAFIGSVLGFFIFDNQNYSALLFLGLLLNGASLALYKSNKQQEFFQQIAIASNLCGQLLVAWGLSSWLDYFSLPFYLTLFVYQCLLVVFIANYSCRLLSTWFALVALSFGFEKIGVSALSVSFVHLLFVGLWLTDLSWAKQSKLCQPIGYGLALSLLIFSGQFFYREFYLLLELAPDSSSWWQQFSFWANQAIVSLLLIALVQHLRSTYKVEFFSNYGLLLLLASIVLAILSYLIAGISAAFLLLLIGFFKQRRMLVIFGVAALLLFSSRYYYSLHWTLMDKSLSLIAFGLVFSTAYYWLHLKLGGKSLSAVNFKQEHSLNGQKKIAVSVLLVILALVNFNIYQKETVLATGQVVLLKLAPVDPRSMMQGDYMRLRFAIESTLLDGDDIADRENLSSGYFVVNRDENLLGSYHDIYRGQALKSNQLKMQFRIRNNRILLATHAFFFEEGTGEQYQEAVYGEFRVSANGELLLNNMRDKAFNIIGYNRPSN